MFSLSKRLLASLAYSAQFQYPQTSKEIKLRLVETDVAARFWQLLFLLAEAQGRGVIETQGVRAAGVQKVDIEELQRKNPIFKKINCQPLIACLLDFGEPAVKNLSLQDCLFELEELGLVVNEGDYWLLTAVLKTKVKSKLKDQRYKKEQQSLLLIDKLQPLIKFARSWDWIKAIGITGSTAVKNANNEADVDLMIVAQSNRLWLARWLLLIWILLRGKKRWPWQHGQDDWCLNLFLEEDSLLLPETKRGIYFAYEACQIDWVYDEDDYKSRFYFENTWLASYLPQWYRQLTRKGPKSSSGENRPDSEFAAKNHHRKQNKFFRPAAWMKRFNLLAFKLQSQYLHNKNAIPYNNLKLKQAFLHGEDLIAGWK